MMVELKLLIIALAYVGVAILLAWFFARQCQTPRAKMTAVILTLVVFALIPTWDIVPGRLYFNRLCETEAGLKIYKTVEGVKGFYYFPGTEFRQEALKHYGYEYVEAGTPPSIYRYSLKEGNLNKEKVNQLSSRYGVQFLSTELLWQVTKYSESIVNLKTNETLSTKTQFYYPGNWIQRKIKPLLGGGRFCPLLPPDSPLNREFYSNTLKPNN